MKATQKLIVTALFTAFAGGAFAQTTLSQEVTPDASYSSVGTPKSRAQVQAELKAALAAGTVSFGTITQDFAARTASVKTREQVQAEVRAARASGELDAMFGEAYAFDAQRPSVLAKTRVHAAE